VTNLGGFDTAPGLAVADAMESAKADYASHAKDAGAALDFLREGSELVILPLEGRDARLAWHVTFNTELQGGMEPGRWEYFVDAKTGDILQSFNSLDTATVSRRAARAATRRSRARGTTSTSWRRARAT